MCWPDDNLKAWNMSRYSTLKNLFVLATYYSTIFDKQKRMSTLRTSNVFLPSMTSGSRTDYWETLLAYSDFSLLIYLPNIPSPLSNSTTNSVTLQVPTESCLSLACQFWATLRTFSLLPYNYVSCENKTPTQTTNERVTLCFGQFSSSVFNVKFGPWAKIFRSSYDYYNCRKWRETAKFKSVRCSIQSWERTPLERWRPDLTAWSIKNCGMFPFSLAEGFSD
jgi:hypothetical protein